MKSFIKLLSIMYLLSLNIYLNTSLSSSSVGAESLASSSAAAATVTELTKDDFLDDFDFENENINSNNNDSLDKLNSTESNSSLMQSIKANDDDIKNIENNVVHNYLEIKKKMIKNAVTKSLTHKALTQKFVEVIPILRVLSSPQKIALSSLISAQISAKPGTELKLSQVRSIFGDNQKLILPLVLDIANMVRSAAKSSLSNHYDLLIEPEQPALSSISSSSSSLLTSAENNINRRVFHQPNNHKNHKFDNENLENVEVTDDNGDDDDNYYGEIMDPIIINNELYDAYHQDKDSNGNTTDIKNTDVPNAT